MPHEDSPSLEKETLSSSVSPSSISDSPMTDRERNASQMWCESSSGTSVSIHDDSHSERSSQDAIGPQLEPITSQGANGLARYTTGISVRTNASIATTADPNFEVDFGEDDPSDPRQWSLWYRAGIVAMISYSTLTVVMYSTSYTSGIPGIMSSFGISSKTIPVLGITTYMLGLAAGSVVVAPLSEMYGRRPVYLIAMAMFCLLTIPCALAPNLEAILVTRFFGAIAGSALIANSPGTVNDIVTEDYRAMAFSLWSLGPMNGPVVGPLVGGFVFESLGWRWTNWLICIQSGVAFCMLFCIRETYAPTVLRKQASQRRTETNDERWWSRYDDKQAFWPLLRVNLKRPFTMAIKEPICIFWNLYIALLYGILYLCFVAYPIVFSNLRGWSPGITGLGYCGIGTGSILCIALEPYIRRMVNAHKLDPETGKPPPEAMMSIVCIAAICVPIGETIFAWTCTPNVHWIVPILAGVPFGFGNCAVFVYSANYLVHSYGVFAASAMAGNGVCRSLMGGSLPLAGPALYNRLGPHWAGTLLALLEYACIPIPFVFYRYGNKIREKSTLIRAMREDQEKQDAKRLKNDAKLAREAVRHGYISSEKVHVDNFGVEVDRVISKHERDLVV